MKTDKPNITHILVDTLDLETNYIYDGRVKEALLEHFNIHYEKAEHFNKYVMVFPISSNLEFELKTQIVSVEFKDKE